MAETSKEQCIHATSRYLMLRNQEILQGTAKCLVCEIERLRAALSNIAQLRVLTDCGIDPMRAAGLRQGFEIAAEEACNALAGSKPDETTALLPADQKLKEFFSKHALGPLARPSCIVCGDVPKDWPPAIQHMELPGIVVCFPCRDAAQATSRHEHKWTPWWNDNSGTKYRYCSCGDQESIAVRAPNTSSGGS
jgi:hypothetical protein